VSRTFVLYGTVATFTRISVCVWRSTVLLPVPPFSSPHQRQLLTNFHTRIQDAE